MSNSIKNLWTHHKNIYAGHPPTKPGISDDGATVKMPESCQIKGNSVGRFYSQKFGTD
jgi:hypothetical protein